MYATSKALGFDGRGRPIEESPGREPACLACGSRHGVVQEDWMAGFFLCGVCLALAQLADEQEPEVDLGEGD